jgi:O-antigen ligase
MSMTDRPLAVGFSLAQLVRFILSAWHNQSARIFNLDVLAVLIAILLPWTTTGVAIVTALWFVALLPSLDFGEFLRSLMRPISLLPIALFSLAVLGVLWSDATLDERLYAIGPAVKLLFLPALFHHYERSERGLWVFKAFLTSCVLLTAASWLVLVEPELSAKQDVVERGIFVKNYIDQSQDFSLCAIALAFPIVMLLRKRKIWQATLLSVLLLSFLLNMAFVIVSRTALVTMPAMLTVFAVIHFRWRTNLAIIGVTIVLAGLVWTISPQLRRTADRFKSDYLIYKENLEQPTSIGYRLEFWMKSLHFVAEAPLVGHGTGSTRGLFERAATGPAVLAAGQVIGNPHNQTLNVAVQWGAIGVVILYAMWFSHLLLFRGEGMVPWIGLLIVTQNMLTSLFNSHLFDFHEGWMYVLGVGVAGGTVLKQRLV